MNYWLRSGAFLLRKFLIRLIEWLKVEHARDPPRLVRAPHLIISHTQRLQLVRAHPDKIKSAADVSTLLDRRSDWAQEWVVQNI